MTVARITTNRSHELEVVRVLRNGSLVLCDLGTGDHCALERERLEVRCDFCGRWTDDVAPVEIGAWTRWMCCGGRGPCPP